MKYIDFDIYNKTIQRDYFKRINKDKPKVMEISKEYGYEYWDGDRKYGYGGYKYDDRWKPIAEKLRLYYKLNPGMKVLDVGCGKGYLLHELKQLCPKLKIYGLDISGYAIDNVKEEIKEYTQLGDIRDIPWKDKYFDLLISLGTIHNLPIYHVKKAIQEIERVSEKSYITMESFRNDVERTNLFCWALTAESYFSDKEWKWILKEFGYTGDYCLFYFN